MKHTLIAAASILAFAVSGSAFAQGTPAKNDMERTSTWQSDDERMMYENDRELYTPFFNDDWSEYRSDDEIRSAFDAMGTEQQDSIRASCQRAAQNRGSYGTVTTALCQVADVDNAWAAN
ncbi:hypothetical protein [Aquibium sp. ELW1220]|jgi:hypothetical protein|uniref:hypothetical protein n=1 Tax=Aquibium sp. ELW1220 TaxID=2976766 RepID=UPI0025B1E368|nr:hypothetical protein [Aquibium sp. ELW1220]MDN2582044.1 hypothetical protein [Aquibium sp. ELW1220]